VLSHALWQSRFGGDQGVIGKDLRIDSQPFTVIGVMPKGFYFLNADVFGVRATDPLVLAAVASILACVAIIACALPAHRATRIDPIIALAE
jgi:hypothetical protein